MLTKLTWKHTVQRNNCQTTHLCPGVMADLKNGFNTPSLYKLKDQTNSVKALKEDPKD